MGLLALSSLTVAACSIDSRAPDAPSETASAGGSMSNGRDGPGGAGTGDAAGAGGANGLGGAGAASAGAGGSGASSDAGSTGSSAGAGGAGAASGAGTNGGSSAGGGASDCPANLLANGDFEAGEEGWVSFSTGGDPLIYDSTAPEYEGVEAHAGQRLGWLGGVPSETNRLSQAVSVPPGATRLGLRYSLRIQIFEQHATIDFLRVRLVIGGVATPIAEFSNADAGEDWVDYAPEPLAITTGEQPLAATLEIESSIGDGPGTNFFVDDVALVPTCAL
jgi:hypothetical protein